MQNILDCVRNRMSDNLWKQSFLYTYILGLAAHAYCFLNLTISHDSLRAFYIAGKWPKASMGRIFYNAYISLTRGKIVLPWLIGVLSLLWVSIAVYIIVRSFEIENGTYVLLVAGICVTNPSVYATAATYLHDLDANSFALLLAVSAAYLWYRGVQSSEKIRTWIFSGIGALLLTIALGIYQSYISVTITLIMLISLNELLKGKRYTEVFCQGISGILMLGASSVMYLFVVKLFSSVTGIVILENDSYNGLGNMSQVFSGNVISKIRDTYLSFFSAFKNLILTSEPVSLMLVVHGLLILCIFGLLFLGIRKLEWKSKILFVTLLILIPFGMNISSFLSNGMYHVLMQYAVWFVYLAALLFAYRISKKDAVNNLLKKVLILTVILCISLTVMENIQTSNTVYVKKRLEYEATLSYMTRVSDRMEEQDGYIPGETPVVFIGEYAVGNTILGFERYEMITGVEYHSPITFYDTYKDYFKYVLGRPISLMDAETVQNDERILHMPIYPKEGSIAMIDGVLIVKLEKEDAEI